MHATARRIEASYPRALPEPVQRRLVVVGNSMASLRAVEELLAIAPGAYRITIFGAEPDASYNRKKRGQVLKLENSRLKT